MFREMLRKKQKLSKDDCIFLLKNEKRGVLSVIGDEGYPYGFPINHYYNEKDGCLYFHCGKAGHKLDALKNCGKASFCVYDKGYKKENDWALNIKSVIVFGRVSIIDDFDTICDISRRLSYKFTSDERYINDEIKRFAKATLLLKLKPEHISGKLVNES
jgi:nitroimidazol reductase NimA-like FMN-containing flavoprotein (pyridoxamine 5'-phosphate oxidase superfamily)